MTRTTEAQPEIGISVDLDNARTTYWCSCMPRQELVSPFTTTLAQVWTHGHNQTSKVITGRYTPDPVVLVFGTCALTEADIAAPSNTMNLTHHVFITHGDSHSPCEIHARRCRVPREQRSFTFVDACKPFDGPHDAHITHDVCVWEVRCSACVTRIA